MEQVIGYALRQHSVTRPNATARSGQSLLRIWFERYTQRQRLRQLDDHLLGDIGVTRADAEAEARKPFWVA